MVTPQNALLGLPALQWRGVSSPPYDNVSYSVSHSLAERRYPYIDGAGHDNTGRDPIEFPFKLYFLNTLQPGLFPDLFLEWETNVIIDKSIGDLIHPFRGKVECRPKSWNVTMSTQAISGAIVDVVFVETIRDPVSPQDAITSTVALNALAAEVDNQMATLGIPYPTGERTTSLKDLIGQVQGLILSTRLSVEGMVNQAQGIVARIVDITESVRKDHETWPLESSLKRLHGSLEDFKEAHGLNFARGTAEHVTQIIETINSVAALVGNTESEIMGLNINLLRSPSIPVGTSVKFFI